MREQFAKLPQALQKQALFRGAMGVVSCLLAVAIFLYTGEFVLSLPCLCLGGYIGGAGLLQLYQWGKKDYVVVSGRCEGITRTLWKKRARFIIIMLEGQQRIIVPCYFYKIPAVGSTVTLYLSTKEPVYEKDGRFILYHYYTMEISRQFQGTKMMR